MDWRLVLTLIAFAIYFIYNCIALRKFGIPITLSKTHYSFLDLNSKLKWCFPLMMVSMAGLLMPAWLDLSDGSLYQFTAFLAAMGIIMVGMIPNVRDGKFHKITHGIFAILAAIFSILWVCLVAGLWYIVLIVLGICIAMMILTKSYKTSIVYWLETGAFISTFVSIILYYILDILIS